MFAPTKVWRKWHRKVAVNQRRYAIASALAASALPSLVMARGHRVEAISELPLVIADEIESVDKTKRALEILKAINAQADIDRVKDSRAIRAGKGKARGRRTRQRRGPLVVYKENNGIVKAFRNIPGVELIPVSALNLLLLAPGGHLGRFVIWTRSAFEQLDALFGSFTEAATLKTGYNLPTAIISNPDISRIISSEEVQSVLRPLNAERQTRKPLKNNPLRNIEAMKRLNPYVLTARQLESSRAKAPRTTTRASKEFVASLRDV